MIRNLFVTILRNFRLNKLYTFVNLTGLVVGFTVFIFTSLFVIHELTYDSYHKNADRIFRIITDNNNYRGFTKFPISPAPLAPALKDEFAEIEATSRLSSPRPARLQANNGTFYEKNWLFTDPDFFRMFSVEFLEGDPFSALSSPSSLILTESLARKIFGTTKVLGTDVKIIDIGSFVITGVIKDFPDNSIFDMKMITQLEATLKIIAPENLENWGNWNYYTFVLLNKNASPEKLTEKLPFFRDKYTNDKLSQEGGQHSHFLLQPLTDIHNDVTTAFEVKPAVPLNRLWILSTVAVIILIIAGINYINLTTAKSITRAKEIGVKKVVGAHESNLILQFLFESLFISVFALALSIILVEILLPYVNSFLDKELVLQWGFVIFIGGCAVVFGLLSGLYPAFVLSGYKPIKVLKGKISNTREGHLFRDILVVIQFSVSAILLITAWGIRDQLQFIQKRDPGYTRDQIITLNWHDRKLPDYWQTLKTEISRIPSIEKISVGSHLPNAITSQQTRTWRLNGEDKTVAFYTDYVDSDFMPLFDMKLLEGRNFKEDGVGERNNFIINETAVKELGIKDPVGKTFLQNDTDTVTIIGIVKDFNFANLRQPVAPMRFRIVENWITKVMIKVNAANPEKTIWDLEQVSRKFAPDYPFDFAFFDDQFMKAYKQDKNTETMANFLTIIALSIAILGLFGLITFSINQRFKEIGIRKVFGAGRINLLFILTNQLNVLMLISFIVAVPFAYFILTNWLSNFAYKVDISLWAFILSMAIILLLAWITVLAKILKAANLNPIQVLRYE